MASNSNDPDHIAVVDDDNKEDGGDPSLQYNENRPLVQGVDDARERDRARATGAVPRM